VENICTARQATDNSMAHALCMLDTLDYKRTLTICNTYCFSTATIVERKPLIVTFIVHGLSSSKYVYNSVNSNFRVTELSHEDYAKCSNTEDGFG
jgi:hypothetical protein